MPRATEDLLVGKDSARAIQFVACEPHRINEKREGRQGERSRKHEADLQPVPGRGHIGGVHGFAPSHEINVPYDRRLERALAESQTCRAPSERPPLDPRERRSRNRRHALQQFRRPLSLGSRQTP
jgi:hypothetical protein